jgi:hypothetical protein
MIMLFVDGRAKAHAEGDLECVNCFNKPQVCKCGGVIHSLYYTEVLGEPICIYQCDRCGIDYQRCQ